MAVVYSNVVFRLLFITLVVNVWFNQAFLYNHIKEEAVDKKLRNYFIPTETAQQHEHYARELFFSSRNNDPNHWSYILDHGSIKGFPTYKEADRLLDAFIAQYPKYVTRYQAGYSIQKRPMWAYRIGKIEDANKNHIYDTNKETCSATDPSTPFDLNTDFLSSTESLSPQILITALHHAREPISLTVVLFFIGQLLELGTYQGGSTNQYETASATIALCRYILDNIEVIVLPFVNPDGYIAIEENNNTDIRKNQRDTCPTNKFSGGVDLNRNYDYFFKSLHSPCDLESYEGTAPFSEPETQAVKCLVDSNNFKLALNFHSFGEFWTRPFNCCKMVKPPKNVQAIYQELDGSIETSAFNSAPNIAALGYTTTGEADDWMLARRGVVSMSPEVGEEQFGFWPPQNLTQKTNEHTFWSILEVARKAGADPSLVLNRISDDVFDIQLFNHGLTDLIHNTTLVLLESNEAQLSQFARWEKFNSSEANSSISPFVPSFIVTAQQKQEILPRSLSSSLTNATLSFPLPPFRARSGTSPIRSRIKQKPQTLLIVCLVELTYCRCTAIPLPDAMLVSPLIVTDVADPLCVESRRASSVPPMSLNNTIDKSSTVGFDPSSHSIAVSSFLINNHLNTLWIPVVVIAEILVSALLLFLFCLIVSLDPEESATPLGSIAKSFVILLTGSFCCLPCCLRLHRQLRFSSDISERNSVKSIDLNERMSRESEVNNQINEDKYKKLEIENINPDDSSSNPFGDSNPLKARLWGRSEDNRKDNFVISANDEDYVHNV